MQNYGKFVFAGKRLRKVKLETRDAEDNPGATGLPKIRHSIGIDVQSTGPEKLKTVRGPPDYQKSGIPLELIYNVPGAVAEIWDPVGL